VTVAAKLRVNLLFFAVLRDITGVEKRAIEVPEGTTALDVWKELRAAHPQLAAYTRPPMTAVNMEYVEAERILREGDELAFIPPVAGG
jgi:molybdopterin converting factor subunit 1